MFTSMMDAIKEESVGYLFNVDVQVEAPTEAAAVPDAGELVESGPTEPGQDTAPQISARGLAGQAQPQRLAYSAPTVDGESASAGVEVSADAEDDPFANVGRNEPCPCGSGRKFKRCHGDPASRAARAQT
jgi:preprotein translocase subunit SecA